MLRGAMRTAAILTLAAAGFGCDPPAIDGAGSGPMRGADPITQAGPTDGVDAGASKFSCDGAPTAGVCNSDHEAATCVIPTGQGEAHVVTVTCAEYETCSAKSGRAQCEVKAGRCEPGAQECADNDDARTCDSSGHWASRSCLGCRRAGVGVACASTPVATRSHSGRVEYEVHLPNASRTDWEVNGVMSPAIGALVLSVVQDPKDPSQSIVIDSTITDGDGKFTVNVAATPSAEDQIQVMALRTDDRPLTAGSLLYAVASPDVPDGVYDEGVPIPAGGDQAFFWGWAQNTLGLADQSVLSITEAMGSGAMRVFDFLRFEYDETVLAAGPPQSRPIVWLRMNTSYRCGSCFIDQPTTFLGSHFDAQIVFPATAMDRDYWADSVIAHELGHWVMATYGTSPEEGGAHSVACPTLPGQAWSEGWATGYSSLVRGDPVYMDKQDGSFFWFDVQARRYSSAAWPTPDARGPLDQLIDENVVASILWHLATNPTSGQAIAENPAFLDALKSPRMNGLRFERGYSRHTWIGSCQRTAIVDTHESAPMVADWLDALACGGFDPATISRGLGGYPYPVTTPLCE
jgi:hypothetical protein